MFFVYFKRTLALKKKTDFDIFYKKLQKQI